MGELRCVAWPSWIKTSQCLPANDEVTLCCDQWGSIYIALHRYGYWITNNYENHNIDRWLPLPPTDV